MKGFKRSVRGLWLDSSGQASIELIGIMPVVILLALCIAGTISSLQAKEAANQAVHAAGMAALRSGDVKAAAAAAVPELDQKRISVTEQANRITVNVKTSKPFSFVAPLRAEATVVVAQRDSR